MGTTTSWSGGGQLVSSGPVGNIGVEMALKLSKNELTFIKALAPLTGLNTRTLQGWVANEEGSRSMPLGHNDHNWLNIGITDSGPMSLTHDAVWKNPVTAAQATADFLKGRKYGASQGIRDILKTAGGSVDSQVNAITHSGWASGGESLLRSLVAQAQGLHGTGGGAAPAAPAPRAPHALATAGTRSMQVAPATGPSQDAAALLAQLGQQAAPPPVYGSAPAAPSFAAGPRMAGSSVAASGGPATGGSVLSAAGVLGAVNAATPSTPARVAKSPATAVSAAGVTAPVSGAHGHGGGASAVVSFAKSRIGQYQQSQGNNLGPQLNTLEAKVGMKGQPWCAIYATTAVVHGTGNKAARTAGVAELTGWAQQGSHGYQRGVLPPGQARAGDLVVRGAQHVGIVVGRGPGGKIIVNEGNAGTGGVEENTYSPSAWTGVVRPKYGR